MPRRFVRFAARRSVAAIVYSKESGSNSEIWLQDGDDSPILLTTVPQRIPLGWSLTGEDGPATTVGYIRRPPVGFAIDAIRTAYGIIGPTVPTSTRSSYEAVGYDGPTTQGQAPTLNSGIGIFPGQDYYVFTNGQNTGLNASSGQLVQIRLNHNVGTRTLTVQSVSNYVAANITKLRTATYVALPIEPYHDTSVPSAGDAWNTLAYWDAGVLTTFSRPDGDIPVGNPLDPQTLDYTESYTERRNNTVDGVLYRYLGDFPSLINGGAVLTGQPITIDGVPSTMSIKGVESGAFQILAVAIIA
jgi:hypothetical protein